eukprot:TRINITY_DN497_c1_g2_i2.p1 TRINITY_DN497_c1_g2~~TRINITY_DN497_c1_g2_i2.p1  ORF type:complete len:887 (-),score=241.83 TRINITY_DN497_c1_g2_i2:771-3431(-)
MAAWQETTRSSWWWWWLGCLLLLSFLEDAGAVLAELGRDSDCLKTSGPMYITDLLHAGATSEGIRDWLTGQNILPLSHQSPLDVDATQYSLDNILPGPKLILRSKETHDRKGDQDHKANEKATKEAKADNSHASSSASTTANTKGSSSASSSSTSEAGKGKGEVPEDVIEKMRQPPEGGFVDTSDGTPTPRNERAESQQENKNEEERRDDRREDRRDDRRDDRRNDRQRKEDRRRAQSEPSRCTSRSRSASRKRRRKEEREEKKKKKKKDRSRSRSEQRQLQTLRDLEEATKKEREAKTESQLMKQRYEEKELKYAERLNKVEENQADIDERLDKLEKAETHTKVEVSGWSAALAKLSPKMQESTRQEVLLDMAGEAGVKTCLLGISHKDNKGNMSSRSIMKFCNPQAALSFHKHMSGRSQRKDLKCSSLAAKLLKTDKERLLELPFRVLIATVAHWTMKEKTQWAIDWGREAIRETQGWIPGVWLEKIHSKEYYERTEFHIHFDEKKFARGLEAASSFEEKYKEKWNDTVSEAKFEEFRFPIFFLNNSPEEMKELGNAWGEPTRTLKVIQENRRAEDASKDKKGEQEEKPKEGEDSPQEDKKDKGKSKGKSKDKGKGKGKQPPLQQAQTTRQKPYNKDKGAYPVPWLKWDKNKGSHHQNAKSSKEGGTRNGNTKKDEEEWGTQEDWKTWQENENWRKYAKKEEDEEEKLMEETMEEEEDEDPEGAEEEHEGEDDQDGGTMEEEEEDDDEATDKPMPDGDLYRWDSWNNRWMKAKKRSTAKWNPPEHEEEEEEDDDENYYNRRSKGKGKGKGKSKGKGKGKGGKGKKGGGKKGKGKNKGKSNDHYYKEEDEDGKWENWTVWKNWNSKNNHKNYWKKNYGREKKYGW